MADNIIDITGLTASSELQMFADAQTAALTKAASRIKQLEDEISHLKELLVSTVPLNPTVPIIVSKEQEIIEVQIEKMRKTAMEREFTLEETKRLDLLLKNWFILKGNDKSISAEFSQLSAVGEAELLRIASAKSPDENG